MVKVATKEDVEKGRIIGIGLQARRSEQVAYITTEVKTTIGARGVTTETAGIMEMSMTTTTTTTLET